MGLKPRRNCRPARHSRLSGGVIELQTRPGAKSHSPGDVAMRTVAERLGLETDGTIEYEGLEFVFTSSPASSG
jgi:hypothetical protein